MPADLVFWFRDTLDVKGYRWAPKSFLAGIGFGGRPSDGDRCGIPGVFGLCVKFPGWILGYPPGGSINCKFTCVLGADRIFDVTCYTKDLRAEMGK